MYDFKNTTSDNFTYGDNIIISELAYIFIPFFIYLASIFLLGVLLLILHNECEQNRNRDIY